MPRPVPPRWVERVAAIMTQLVKIHIYRTSPDREVQVLEAMCQCRSTPGRPDVAADR